MTLPRIERTLASVPEHSRSKPSQAQKWFALAACLVTLPAVADWTVLETVDDHNVGIKDDGTLWTWGSNHNGQLGIGNDEPQSIPIQVGSDAWAAAAAGKDHTLAIRQDGTLWGWGENYFVQIAGGLPEEVLEPQQIGTGTDWIAVAGGRTHSVALRLDGTLWAWGDNEYGQLGLGDTLARPEPTQVGTATDWVKVSAGAGFTVAQRRDGTLWTWGIDAAGQLGDGASPQWPEYRPFPAPVNAETDWGAFDAGFYHVLATKTDGTLWGWGETGRGQLGLGLGLGYEVPDAESPTKLSDDTNWKAVSGGWLISLALKSDGSLWATGTSYHGELGDGSTMERDHWAASAAGPWRTVSAGDYHSVLVDTDGQAWATGRRDDGQLGDGIIGERRRLTPGQVGSANDWDALFAAEGGAMAIRSNGSLWGWGSNREGQLADPALGKVSNIPVQVGPLTGWKQVDAGRESVLAVRTDGTLWGWGANQHGELGDGTLEPKAMPTQIGIDSDWDKVLLSGAWEDYAVAQRQDGTLWAWGHNVSITPTPISTDTDWTSFGSVFGVKSDGTLWQLGDAAVRIGSDTDWTAVWDGDGAYALKSDGSLWHWNWNWDWAGTQGLGGQLQMSSPQQVGTDTGFVTLALGDGFVQALKADGSRWAWGNNNWDGQFGNGNDIPTDVPTRADAESWLAVATSGYTAYGLRADGTLWAWGYGGNGQFGDGQAWSTVPVRVHEPLLIADADGDGVPDSADNCPSNANAGQFDFDGDGQGDVCDLDDDGDGVDDLADTCPMVPTAGIDADFDGCTDTASGLLALLQGLPGDALAPNIMHSLKAKLDAMLAAKARGDVNAADNVLGAFIQQVAALSGKKIGIEAASMLINYALNLRANG